MTWRKITRIFRAEGQRDWMVSLTSCPQAQQVDGDLYRIWFSPRDAGNRSYCGWLELDITRPEKVLRLAETPALAPGGLGAFDEQGAMFSWLMVHEDRCHLYYTGWNIGDTVPLRNAIGLATAPAGGVAFERASTGPVLDRSPFDPYFVGNPCVLAVGGEWHLWYLSGTAWTAGADGKPAWSAYNIRHARSADGMVWRPSPAPAIDHIHPDEMAIARPCVCHEDGLFRMWYCYRGTSFSYRIGYAESGDGVHWSRKDETVGLQASRSGWDSEMVAYPHVFRHRGATYMLYCGNGFSRDGFGLAVLEG